MRFHRCVPLFVRIGKALLTGSKSQSASHCSKKFVSRNELREIEKIGVRDLAIKSLNLLRQCDVDN